MTQDEVISRIISAAFEDELEKLSMRAPNMKLLRKAKPKPKYREDGDLTNQDSASELMQRGVSSKKAWGAAPAPSGRIWKD